MKTTSWGIDMVLGTQNSYSQQIKIIEISEQEYQKAKEKISIVKTYPSYYEELSTITDSFCTTNNINDKYSLQTHYLLSEQHLKNKGLCDHVKIGFMKREKSGGFVTDSSIYLITMQASNNIIKQIQIHEGLYGFYFGEYFKELNLFEINLTCEFGPMGELLFDTKEGYLYKTDGELIARSHDSLLLFETNYLKYFPGPGSYYNKVEFYDCNSSELYCFDLDSIVSKLSRKSNFNKKESEIFWGISDFFVVKKIVFYDELKVVYYEAYVNLSGVISNGEENYSIVENKYYKMNPRDVVINKKTH